MVADLVEHSVSKAEQLPEEVEPAVQEGEKAQQQQHDACEPGGERRFETGSDEH